ncbi:hypothetical protein [Teredinibacter turnerae]|uniref:hypothetical protein n=1 Tax=Teredinibacter turnerae TaxID=2426 RepID=UPI00037EB90A|nr:hypothetical protein [Teredinibacter turnerae]
MIELATIAQAVAVVAACWAIISGVGAWKREFIGKRKIELAEETLAVYFEIKDAIALIRSPWSSGTEGNTRKRSEQETEAEARLLDRGYIVFERYESKKEVFVRFNTLKYKFMAVFGTDTESIFKDTNQTLNSIFSSANMLSTHYWQRQGRVKMEADEFQKHLDEMHQHEGIFWDRYNEDDKIRTQLSETQKLLETTTKSCFEEPMKTYTIFTKKWFRRG